MPAADNSKELCSPAAATDPAECADGDAAVAGDDCVSAAKGEAAPADAVAAPIPEGKPFCVLDRLYASDWVIKLVLLRFTYGVLWVLTGRYFATWGG